MIILQQLQQLVGIRSTANDPIVAPTLDEFTVALVRAGGLVTTHPLLTSYLVPENNGGSSELSSPKLTAETAMNAALAVDWNFGLFPDPYNSKLELLVR